MCCCLIREFYLHYYEIHMCKGKSWVYKFYMWNQLNRLHLVMKRGNENPFSVDQQPSKRPQDEPVDKAKWSFLDLLQKRLTSVWQNRGCTFKRGFKRRIVIGLGGLVWAISRPLFWKVATWLELGWIYDVVPLNGQEQQGESVEWSLGDRTVSFDT